VKKLFVLLALVLFILFILISSCVEEPGTREEGEEKEGLPPGYNIDVCKCHHRPMPKQTRRIVKTCQSGTSQIIKCSRDECKTEACIWFGTRCPYPYWKEICD
jgi:hypothetical protein